MYKVQNGKTDKGLRGFISRHQRYAPLLFFIGGFVFDSLTLGRVDRTYDLVVLCLHMISLTLTIYLYNLTDDGTLENTIFQRFTDYFPVAIQFFFGALSSAYVVYFSRSVSFSKTMSFFVILIVLFIANEFLKKRISNKYLQFGVYFFVSFTFFSFMVPVFIKQMNQQVFIASGITSLLVTLTLVLITYFSSPSTRKELKLGKLLSIIAAIYISINIFYFLKLIPPVPLALDQGIVAHNVVKRNNEYIVTYEPVKWYHFWQKPRFQLAYQPGKNVYVFSSIFAPTNIHQSVVHRWYHFYEKTKEWKVIEDIEFEILGGRDEGYRGYTFKNNLWEGTWKVEVITNEELVLGVIDFIIIVDNSYKPNRLTSRKF